MLNAPHVQLCKVPVPLKAGCCGGKQQDIGDCDLGLELSASEGQAALDRGDLGSQGLGQSGNPQLIVLYRAILDVMAWDSVGNWALKVF